MLQNDGKRLGFTWIMHHHDTILAGLLRFLAPAVTGVVALALTIVEPAAQAADSPIQLKVVGGLAGVSQYTKLEEPFWTHQVSELTRGRVQAEIHPSDRSGLP